LLWCSAALRLKDRDTWIGWDTHRRSQRLKLVVNNARFLVPEAERRHNMASRVLAVSTAALAGQYETQYGYRPVLAETFTDPRKHKGTCYRAAGWVAVGETAGYGRHRAEFLAPRDWGDSSATTGASKIAVTGTAMPAGARTPDADFATQMPPALWLCCVQPSFCPPSSPESAICPTWPNAAREAVATP